MLGHRPIGDRGGPGADPLEMARPPATKLIRVPAAATFAQATAPKLAPGMTRAARPTARVPAMAPCKTSRSQVSISVIDQPLRRRSSGRSTLPARRLPRDAPYSAVPVRLTKQSGIRKATVASMAAVDRRWRISVAQSSIRSRHNEAFGWCSASGASGRPVRSAFDHAACPPCTPSGARSGPATCVLTNCGAAPRCSADEHKTKRSHAAA